MVPLSIVKLAKLKEGERKKDREREEPGHIFLHLWKEKERCQLPKKKDRKAHREDIIIKSIAKIDKSTTLQLHLERMIRRQTKDNA